MRSSRQFLLFAAMGAIGTAAHYLTLILLVSAVGLHPGVGAAAGAVMGAAINYLLNRRFTFRSEGQHLRTIARYALVAALGAFLNGLLVGWLSNAGLHYLLGQVLATLVILAGNYFASQKWIFASR